MDIKKFLFNLFKIELVLSIGSLIKVKAGAFKVNSAAYALHALTSNCTLMPPRHGMCTLARWDKIPRAGQKEKFEKERELAHEYTKKITVGDQSKTLVDPSKLSSPHGSNLTRAAERLLYERDLKVYEKFLDESNAELLEHNNVVSKFYEENSIDVKHCLFQNQLGHYVVKRYFYISEKLYQLTYILTTNPYVSKDIKAIQIPEGRLDGKEGLQMVCPIPYISEIGTAPYLPHGGIVLEKSIKNKVILESSEKFHDSFDKAILKSYESNTYIRVFDKSGDLNEIKEMSTEELKKGFVSGAVLESIGLIKNMDLYSFHYKKDVVLKYLTSKKVTGGAVSAESNDLSDKND